ncbi:MAG: 1-phosphofructokinase family hexose kinase [Segetibacter sp.]|jgi:6-phosphofructokinase 2|nr:1-phosphofructokinase family hexose kinase [Segetibacter sp.]
MQKIVTLTLNPAIDKSTTVNAIVPDRKLRCSQPVFEPGGGGVNVSRAIKKLGGTSTAIYIAGGYSGNHLQHLLDEEGIESCVVQFKGHTRENLIVVDESSNSQYRFGMPGPALHENEWQKCLDLLKDTSGVEYIVASGSLPEGVPEDFFGRLACVAKKVNAKLIVDTSGEPLRHATNEGVFMIKPNLGELSNLYGKDELREADIIKAARAIINKGGSEVMVISMGASGAMLITKDDLLEVSSPTVKSRSTVGAGDSMVAGMVLALTRGSSWLEVLQYGIATGTATTMNPGTELCKREDVERLYECLRAKKV